MVKPLLGQRGIPGVAPDITPIVSLFINTPAPKLPPSEVRAIKMSVGELMRAWCKWLGWSAEDVAQVVKELADEGGWAE